MSLQPVHRARRFFSSLGRAAPDPGNVEELLGTLNPEERRLFDGYNAHDRAHSLAVAVAVEGVAGADPEWVPQAALMHDIGKTISDPSTTVRVVGSILAMLGFRKRSQGWIRSGGSLARLGRYMNYQALGADLLRNAGSDPRVVAWATEHHSPPEEWTVPHEGALLLRNADDTA